MDNRVQNPGKLSRGDIFLDGVEKSFGEGEARVQVLRGVDLEIHTGEVLLLVGPSGCGKTTLLSVLAGVLNSSSGVVEAFGSRIDQMTQSEKAVFRRDNVGFIFQQFNLVPTLTAAENAAVPLLIRKEPYAAAIRKAREFLALLSMKDRTEYFPSQLSGGQQQRIAIARSLITNPRLLICDEPTASLDGEVGHQVMELLRTVSRDANRAVVIVTHDNRIFSYGDRMAQMVDGRIIGVREIGGGIGQRMRRFVNILLPLFGIAFAIFWVVLSSRKGPSSTPVKPPAVSNYPASIAASGIIEASSQNISVMPEAGGKMVRLLVSEGEHVHRGQPLYQLDDHDLRSQRAQAAAALAVAQASVDTVMSQLRQARASVIAAKANQESLEASFSDLSTQARTNGQLYKEGILSYIANNTSQQSAEAADRRVSQAREQVNEAEDQVAIAEGQLAQARANVESNRGRRDQLDIDVELLCVKAPMDGVVLQVNSYPGETVTPGQATAPVLLGSTNELEVRVDVDETNAPFVKAGEPAVAHLRGDSDKSFPVTFFRIEPYVIPKENLTGSDTERVDVRVLQVLYRFKPPAFPVYTGEQVDVFIARDEPSQNR